MMSIKEFEDGIIENGIGDGDLCTYEKLLSDLNINYLRLRRCFELAKRFPKERADEAIALIDWSMERYKDVSWFDLYKSYLNKGYVYENAGRYKEAYDIYLKAYDIIPEEEKSYRNSLAGNLMWMLLHIDSFKYSSKLSEYYFKYSNSNKFDRASYDNQFRIAIADLVISQFSYNFYKFRDAYEDTIRLTLPQHISEVPGDPSKQRCAPYKVKTTPESIEFLKNLDLFLLE